MPKSEHLNVFATLVALPGRESDLREALSALVAPTKAEPGNITYILTEDVKNPGHFWYFETYKDQAAVDAHMNSPYLAAALEKAKTWLAATPVIVTTKTVAGE